MKWLDNCLLTLAVIGCIVWGLIGFFQFNLVSFIFGNGTWLTRVIYALVGLSGLHEDYTTKLVNYSSQQQRFQTWLFLGLGCVPGFRLRRCGGNALWVPHFQSFKQNVQW